MSSTSIWASESEPPSGSWVPDQERTEGLLPEYQQRLDLPAGFADRASKFSQAQKVAAIEHYLSHDRCIAAMRALGHPGRGTLTAWVREAVPEVRMAIVGSAGQRRFSESFKHARIIELCTRQESAQAVADKLGVCRSTLYNWENQRVGREAPASMKHSNQSLQVRESEALVRQVEALRLEVMVPSLWLDGGGQA